MLFREIRILLRVKRFLTLLPVLVIAIGFAGTGLTLALVSGIRSRSVRGLATGSLFTLAEESGGGNSEAISWKAYSQIAEALTLPHVNLAAYAPPVTFTLLSKATQYRVSIAAVSHGFFSNFTHPLLMGRDFSTLWQLSGTEGEIVVSHQLATDLFGSNVDPLDQLVKIGGHPFRVVGVAPADFAGLWEKTDAWITPKDLYSLYFGGHLVDHGDFSASLFSAPGMWKRSPTLYALTISPNLSNSLLRKKLQKLVRSPLISPYHLHVSAGLTTDPLWDYKLGLWIRLGFLLSVVLTVAGIFNYCGLMLAELPHLLDDLRLKLVLGAPIRRLIRDALAGPMFVVLLGYVLGTVLAGAAMWSLLKYDTHLGVQADSAWRTLSSVLCLELPVACIVAIMVSLIPGMRLMHDRSAQRTTYTTTRGRKEMLLLYSIVSFQIASCIVLSLLATRLIRGASGMSHERIGYRADSLSAIVIDQSSEDTPVEINTNDSGNFPFAAFVENVLSARTNGVGADTAASSCAPFGRPMRIVRLMPLGSSTGVPLSIQSCAVTSNFFRTIGNKVTRGSGFSSSGLTGEVSEVVISQQLAQYLKGSGDPLKQTVRIEEPLSGLVVTARVVGIAEDMRLYGRNTTPEPTVFLPLKGNMFTQAIPLYLMTRGSAGLIHRVEEAANKQAAATMSAMSVKRIYRIDDLLKDSQMQQTERVYASVGGALLVAFIAYLGLYGVLLYSVNSRKKEMALRLCFGASRWMIQQSVIVRAMQCTLIAILLSVLVWKLVVAILLAPWIGGTELTWKVILCVSIACMLFSVLVSSIPAVIASNTKPTDLLRE